MAEKKKATSTELALASTTDIFGGIDFLKARLAALEEVSTTPFKTGSAKVPNFPNCIKDENNATTVRLMYGIVCGAKMCWDLSNEEGELGKAKETFKYQGYTQAEWRADAKLKIRKINQEEEEKALKQDIKDLEELLDKEDKKKMVLTRLADKYSKKSEE